MRAQRYRMYQRGGADEVRQRRSEDVTDVGQWMAGEYAEDMHEPAWGYSHVSCKSAKSILYLSFSALCRDGSSRLT